MKPGQASPRHQARLFERTRLWLEEGGRLPSYLAGPAGENLANELRRSYRRGTLSLDTQALLRSYGADTAWFDPHGASWQRHFAAVLAARAVLGRLPGRNERWVGLSVGRWLDRQRSGKLTVERRELLAQAAMDINAG